MLYKISKQKMIQHRGQTIQTKRPAMSNFLASVLTGTTDHAIIKIGTKILRMELTVKRELNKIQQKGMNT